MTLVILMLSAVTCKALLNVHVSMDSLAMAHTVMVCYILYIYIYNYIYTCLIFMFPYMSLLQPLFDQLYFIRKCHFFPKDVDECLSDSDSNCTQGCNNTRGGYDCFCLDGFLLKSDGYNCAGSNNNAQRSRGIYIESPLIMCVLEGGGIFG